MYFIFRNDGTEVTVDLRNGYPKGDKKLTQDELSFIYENII